jgi:hypothetical protein
LTFGGMALATAWLQWERIARVSAPQAMPATLES